MIDLHLHLDGSLTPGEILHLAKQSGVTLPCAEEEHLLPLLRAEPECESLTEYLHKFDLPLQVLQTKEAVTSAVYFLLKRLSQQGLCYAEIRFAPQLHTRRGLTQRQVAAAAVAGLKKGMAEFGMPVQLILCCMRMRDARKENLETVQVAKEFLGKGVCALDLAGDEAGHPTKEFSDIFRFAKESKIPFILHAGEAAGAESVRQALDLGARRIGHGIRSIEDSALLARLAEEKIPLELCFTSNLQTKAATDVRTYPIRRFLELGIPVTVNTDNMTVSDTCLLREYRRLGELFALSEDTLIDIALTAADAAFLSQEQISRLKETINQTFSTWLNQA